MKISKTNAKKFLSIISKSKKKYFTCDDLSAASGLKKDVIIDYISNFYPFINLDENYDLKQLLPEIEAYVSSFDNIVVAKPTASKVTKKDYEEYEDLIDFIYKKMTIAGGILDTGYVVTEKDKKIIKKLISKK